MNGRRAGERGRPSGGPAAAAVVALAAIALCAGLPVFQVIRDGVAGGAREAGWAGPRVFALGVMWATFIYPLVIAALAVVLAWPVAWALRRVGAKWFGLALVPLLLPSYLAYASWGSIRGPTTWLGGALARGPVWWTDVAVRVQAVVGLALWVWPLALIPLYVSVARVSGGALEALAMEPASRARRLAVRCAMVWRGALAGLGLAWVAMLGSPVALHVAQVETLAVRLWFAWDLTHDAAAVWMRAWPLAAVSLAVGWAAPAMVGSRGAPAPKEADGHGAAGVGRGVVVVAAAVWLVSALGPGAVLAFAALGGKEGVMGRWWRDQGDAFLVAMGVAGVVGAAVALIGACVWLAASGRGGATARVAGGVVGAFVAWAAAPGVLVGAASLRWWNAAAPGVLETLGPLVIALVGRFGFVGVLAGWWLARTEPRELKESRLIHGPHGVGSWARACLRERWGVLVAAGLGACALALHEIEATVQLVPPGVPSLAVEMLDDLHRARDERLAAGSVALTAVSVGIGVAAWAAARRGRSPGGLGGA